MFSVTKSFSTVRESSSRKLTCPFRIFSFATSIVNHSARSTSGKSRRLPERGGHSIEKVLLTILVASQSPLTAQPYTSFPAVCLIGARARKFPSGRNPVSSRNSRFAALRRSSPSDNSPFGIDHDPASFFAQKGPPGCTRNTSSVELRHRYIRIPALSFLAIGLSTKTIPLHFFVLLWDASEANKLPLD